MVRVDRRIVRWRWTRALQVISTEHNFIFIHIPKTAGNSIQAALQEYADDQLVFQPSKGHVRSEDGFQGLAVLNPALGFVHQKDKHATAQEYRQALGERFFGFRRFTSIRNPFDRVISYTAFMTGMADGRPSAEKLRLPLPLTHHLRVDGKIGVENYLRFENLAEDLDAICRTLGIRTPQLRHLNASRRDTGYRDYYTDSTRTFVAQKYAEDLEMFGYEF